jgi:acetyl-CoA carboxylase biotin carboxyl carrier protein
MTLDLDQLRALFDLLAEKEIAEFEHEQGGVRVRVTRGARGGAPGAVAAFVAPAAPPSASAAGSEARLPADYVDVTSPFVGSFYRSPAPDVPPFVEVGSVVVTGQTLCIIEAMKLMNEIEAECSGTIVEVFAQNGKSVEYGQRLFRIKKA